MQDQDTVPSVSTTAEVAIPSSVERNVVRLTIDSALDELRKLDSLLQSGSSASHAAQIAHRRPR